MKKILLLIALFCSAYVVNAASVTWRLSSVQVSNGDGVASGYLAMVFDSSTAQDSVINAILSRNSTSLKELAKSNWAQDTKSTEVGNMSSSGNGSYSANDSFSVYLVLFDSSSIESANNYFISTTQEGKIASNGANTTLRFGTFASQVEAQGKSWQSIPEPTSGLLILLGMAGLALRRKQK